MRTLALGAFAAIAAVFLLFLPRSRGEFLDANSPVPEVGAPGGPDRHLSIAEREQWIRGRLLFDRDFHQNDGLGTPELNGDSCRGCHLFPVIGGAGGLDVNVTHFARIDPVSGAFEPLAPGPIAPKLRRADTAGRMDIPAAANVFEQRNSPSLLGLGLLEAVSDQEIASRADPDDLNQDGISGRARWIDVGGGAVEVGRYGWKAKLPRLRDFVVDALGEELGLTTPHATRPFGLRLDQDLHADPEIDGSQGIVDDLSFFVEHLAPPRRKNPGDAQVQQGELLFETVGCALCHVPFLQGSNGPVYAYTDLLLHDVAPAGYRGVEEPGAGQGEFRTPPLWGVSETWPYMHDGSAETLEAAILAHHGEATAVTAAYAALSPMEQAALLAFLRDL